MLIDKRRPHSHDGFTIIELIIMVAIAGLIITIVFIGVPHLQRTQRNFARKSFAHNVLYGAMEEYKSNSKDASYPLDGTHAATNDDNRCNFLRQYIVDAAATCTETGDPNGDDNCVTNVVGRYRVCFHNNGGSHEYVGQTDEFSIELGHQCADDPTATEHIESAGPDDSNFKRYAIWTRLEPQVVYCIDNGNPF